MAVEQDTFVVKARILKDMIGMSRDLENDIVNVHLNDVRLFSCFKEEVSGILRLAISGRISKPNRYIFIDCGVGKNNCVGEIHDYAGYSIYKYEENGMEVVCVEKDGVNSIIYSRIFKDPDNDQIGNVDASINVEDYRTPQFIFKCVENIKQTFGNNSRRFKIVIIDNRIMECNILNKIINVGSYHVRELAADSARSSSLTCIKDKISRYDVEKIAAVFRSRDQKMKDAVNAVINAGFKDVILIRFSNDEESMLKVLSKVVALQRCNSISASNAGVDAVRDASSRRSCDNCLHEQLGSCAYSGKIVFKCQMRGYELWEMRKTSNVMGDDSWL